MLVRFAAIKDNNGQKYITMPDGQAGDGLITFRGGLSLEQFDTDKVPVEIAVMAAMNGWHAEIGGQYYPVRSEKGGIAIVKGKDDHIALKSKAGLHADIVKPGANAAPVVVGTTFDPGAKTSLTDEELDKLTDPGAK